MTTISGKDIRKIIVACDAGMGSSVLLASNLRNQLSAYEVTVEHTPVNTIPADADVVVCQSSLAQRARESAPGKVVLPFRMFLGDPAINQLVEAVRDGGQLEG
jgi:mannitol-specific phosphotransferase system IIBC component